MFSTETPRSDTVQGQLSDSVRSFLIRHSSKSQCCQPASLRPFNKPLIMYLVLLSDNVTVIKRLRLNHVNENRLDA